MNMKCHFFDFEKSEKWMSREKERERKSERKRKAK